MTTLACKYRSSFSSAFIIEGLNDLIDDISRQELYRDPNQEEITVIVNKEQRTLFYGTANGTLRRLDFPSSEIGGSCQSTLLLSGHIHPGTLRICGWPSAKLFKQH